MADALTASDIQTDTFTGKQAANINQGGAHDGSKTPLVLLQNPRDTTAILVAQDDTLTAGIGAPRSGWSWTTGASGFLGLLSMVWDVLTSGFGVDAAGTGAGTQAGSSTVGTGLRGWLSTQVGLLQSGAAKVSIKDVALTPVAGFQQIALSTGTPQGLTAPGTATTAVINVEGGGMRYRDDGTPPTSTVGALYPAGSVLSVTLASLAAVSLAMDSGSTSAKANVSYYR